MPSRGRPHHNFLLQPSPLRHEPDSPSSPRSPLAPRRPLPTSPLAVFLPLSYQPSPLGLNSRSLKSPSTEKSPEEPLAWVWYCHICGTRYGLSVTRRCLNDGHYFCARAEVPPSPGKEHEVNNVDTGGETELSGGEIGANRIGGTTSAVEIIEKMKRERRRWEKAKRKKGSVRGCEAEFDYVGWARYNLWRRGMESNKRVARSRTGTTLKGRRGPRTVFKMNCFHDCNFPSECYYSRLGAAKSRIAQEGAETRGDERKRKMETNTSSRKRKRDQNADGPSPPLATPQDQRTGDLRVPTNDRGVAANHEQPVQGAPLLPQILDLDSKITKYIDNAIPPPILIIERPPGDELGDEFVGIDFDDLGEDGHQLEYLRRRKKFNADGGNPTSP